MSDNPTRCTTTLPVDSPRLSNRPTEPELMEQLEPLVKWQKFGIYLPKMSNAMIEKIENDKMSTDLRKLALFSEWLKVDSSATWDKVIAALSKANEHTLASKIQENLITIIPLVDPYQGTCNINDKIAERITVNDDTQTNMEVLKRQTKEDNTSLHCTPCTQSESQSNEIIITELTISSKDLVAIELKRLLHNFTSLVRRIISHLEEMIKASKCKLTDIARHIGLLLSEDIELDKLTELTTIDKLFNEIKAHYCFLNCALIESIVNEFLCGDVLQTELQHYLQELDVFEESTELQDIKEAIKKALPPRYEATDTTCEVIIKLTKRWENMTIKSLKRLLLYLFGEVLYSHIQILPGSICVRFLLSHLQCQSLILIATEKTVFVHQLGIFEITVDGKLIFVKEEDTTIIIEQSLLQAAQADQNNDISILLELGVDIDYQNEEGRTAIMLATNGEHEKVLKMLISAGAKVDIPDNNGCTALMIACENNSYKIVDLLLQAQASPKLQNNDGWNALMAASFNSHYQVVELLLKQNADPNLQAEKGVTALILASKNGHYHIVELLLKAKANPNLQTQDGRTALMYSSQKGYHQVTEYLLAEKADPNLQTQTGSTALILASGNGHYQIVKLLLKGKADPDLQKQNGSTALMHSCEKGYYQITKHLLMKEANPNLQTQNGLTALMLASENSHYQVVKALLKNNADPNIQTHDGWTALIYASQNGHYQVVKALLKNNADPNLQTQNGWTALMSASQNGHYRVVELLLKENVNPNHQEEDGWTALILASKNGHHQVVELLLKGNANPNLQTQNGVTALMIAKHNIMARSIKFLNYWKSILLLEVGPVSC